MEAVPSGHHAAYQPERLSEATIGRLSASVNGGWYAAWWPSADSVKVVHGYDRAGSLIGSAP